MRLIDANELKDMFPDNGEGSWTYNVTVKACIDEQPTVDAIPYEVVQELLDNAMTYRNRFQLFSVRWEIADKQASLIKDVLDAWENIDG